MNKNTSLYIHFPFCRHLCNYCDFYKSAPSANERNEKILEFQKYLSNSFGQLKKFLNNNNETIDELETLYIGGGTPSLWGEEGARFLKKFLNESGLVLNKNCEATLEVNPGTWTPEGLKAFQEIGFNRYSLGVQSTRSDFLEKLDRVHRQKEVRETLTQFQRMNTNFSVDFMLGLPYSEEFQRNVLEELEEILSYNPDHLSLYILTVKDNYRFYGNLPNEEFVEKEFLMVSDFLSERGYEHYEVSNFAKPGKKSLHNSRYWRGESVAALGPSATGYCSSSHSRFKWKPNSNVIDIESLTQEEVKMEKFYLSFRTSEGVLLNQYFDQNELPKIRTLAEVWCNEELAVLNKDHLALLPRGYLVMDSLMGQIFSSSKSL